MKNSQRLFLVLLMMLGFVLSACGGQEPDPPSLPTQAPAEVNEPEPTDEPTATTAPTDTPVPTDTPAPTATPEPTATPDPAANFELFEDSENGISIRYPSDWFTQGAFGFNTFASAEELLDSPDPGEEGGVALFLAATAEEIGATDPVEALNRAVDEFNIGTDIEFVDEPTAITVNGQDGAIATLHTTSDNGTPLSGLLGIVFNGERAALLIGATPQETETDFFPTFEAMFNTIMVTEPTVAASSTTNLPESQGFLLYGDSVDGTISADEVVVWNFIGVAGETFDLTVTPQGELDVIVDVVDAEGNSILPDGEVDDSFSAEEIMGVTLETTGDLSIVLKGFASSTGDYTLTLNQSGAAGDSFPSSGTLAYGDRVQSTVLAADPAKWSFAAAAEDIVTIVVTPLGDTIDVVVDVLDAAGNSILPNGEIDDSFSEERIADLEIPADGNYIISVRDFADAGGNFALSLSATGSGTMAYGDSATGTIAGSDTSQHTFFGNANDWVDITVAPEGDEFDLVVDVLDSNGRSILPDGEQDASFGIERIRVLALPEGGLYTIVVRGFEGSTGDYEVTVGLSNDGQANTALHASDTISEADEDHIFPFVAPAGDQVTAILWPTTTDFDVVLEVYDDETDEVIDSVDLTTGFEELTFAVPSGGSYYFTVKGFEGSTGDYDITLVGPATTQFVLAAGDVIDGRFPADGVIEYWYDGAADETIVLTLEPDTDTDALIRILDENGEMLTEIDENLYGEAEELSYTFDAEMSVIIEVSDFFGLEGNFTFTIE